ncbi:MAG: hypothetical protein RL567_1081 [Bacteroidota bacterium]|jgi:hypothetical protein
MAKQNNQQQSSGNENPIIKKGKETPIPRPTQDNKDKK